MADGVAEVHHADHPPVLGPAHAAAGDIHQDVVIVRISVNDAHAKLRDQGPQRLQEPLGHLLQELSLLRVHHELQMGTDHPAGGLEVPMKLPVLGRVGEVLERPVHPAEEGAQAPEERRGMGVHFPEEPSWNPGEETGEKDLPLWARNLHNLAPVGGVEDFGEGESTPTEVFQDPVLEVQDLRVFPGGGEVEEVFSTRSTFGENEPLVSTPGKNLPRGDRNGETLRGDAQGLLQIDQGGKLWHAYHCSTFTLYGVPVGIVGCEFCFIPFRRRPHHQLAIRISGR